MFDYVPTLMSTSFLEGPQTSLPPRAPVGLHGDSRRFLLVILGERAGITRVTGDELDGKGALIPQHGSVSKMGKKG